MTRTHRTSGFVIGLALLLPLVAGVDAAQTGDFSVNGLKVILKRNTSNDVVAATLYIRGGSLNLTETTQGIDRLLFESITKGSTKYPRETIEEELARMGTEISVDATQDSTAISLRCIGPNFAKSWDIFADAIMHPLLASKEVELIRERLLSEVRQRHDTPDERLEEVAQDQFYRGHPYRFDPRGKETPLREISTDELRKHLRDSLVTSKLLLVVVGNLERAGLEKQIVATFGTLPRGSYVTKFPPAVAHAKPELKVESEKLPTNYIVGTFSAPSVRDEDYYPMRVAISVLQSRVFEEVRTKRNLSYAPAVFYNGGLAASGGLYVTAVDPAATLPVMLAEVDRIQREPISAKELRDKITTFLTSYYLSNETNARQASFLANFELAGLGWKASEEFVTRMQKVTPEQVRDVARKYIHDLQFAVVGDPAKIDRVLFTSK